MSNETKKELYPIILSLGMLSIYAVQNKIPQGHKIYKLISDIQKIVKLYKHKYEELLGEAFDKLDKIVGDEGLEIDTIAFTNALLVFHSQNKKLFHPNQKLISKFWLEYKQRKDRNITNFKNSRELAKKFYENIDKINDNLI